MKSENQQAVAAALTCLRRLGIDIPAHPTQEQVQAEYEAVWQTLDGRPIESLIDLPLMTDPELQAAMQVFVGRCTPPPTLPTSVCFACMYCRMVKISLQHGMSGASAHGLCLLGDSYLERSFTVTVRVIVSPSLHATWSRSMASSRVRRKFTCPTGVVAAWTQPIATAIDFVRAGFRAAIETGDLTFACYSACSIRHTTLLLRNDPLDAVWRESEMALDFARKARYATSRTLS